MTLGLGYGLYLSLVLIFKAFSVRRLLLTAIDLGILAGIRRLSLVGLSVDRFGILVN